MFHKAHDRSGPVVLPEEHTHTYRHKWSSWEISKHLYIPEDTFIKKEALWLISREAILFINFTKEVKSLITQNNN